VPDFTDLDCLGFDFSFSGFINISAHLQGFSVLLSCIAVILVVLQPFHTLNPIFQPIESQFEIIAVARITGVQ
jgi:hypothetical protein